VVVKEGDQAYYEAMAEAWLGGKKNDVILLIGAPEFPRIAWAAVLSWTKAEEMKIAIREGVMALPEFDGSAVLALLKREVSTSFVRRPMSDFEYLRASVEPSPSAQAFLFVLGVALSIGLKIAFWKHDVFSE
jgi:hypothetical protein